MANETTKRQPDQQDSTTGSKTGSAGQQATQGSHDTRKAEERYGRRSWVRAAEPAREAGNARAAGAEPRTPGGDG